MVQAGASDDGRDLAAETADVVFTAHQSMESAQAFYADLKRRVAGFGRNPDDLKIMPGFFVTVGRTEQEAKDKFARVQELIHPDVGVRLLSTFINFDLTGYPVDGPLPEIPESKVSASRRGLLTDIARRDNLTIRQLYTRIAGGRGHFQFVGTPAQVADELERWFVGNGAADGFNIMPPILPAGPERFRRHGDPGIAAARPVPHRLRRHHACARTSACPGPCPRRDARLSQLRNAALAFVPSPLEGEGNAEHSTCAVG